MAWIGRAAAAIERWNIVHMPSVSVALIDHPSDYVAPCRKTLATLKILLQQAKSDLSVKLGRSGVVIAEGRVFEYFNELRKMIETARCPHLLAGAQRRLLGPLSAGTDDGRWARTPGRCFPQIPVIL